MQSTAAGRIVADSARWGSAHIARVVQQFLNTRTVRSANDHDRAVAT